MKLKKPINSNYCITIVKVGKDIPLPNMDNIVHKNIFGNMVITGKGVLPEGTLALYIPVESQLSPDYCKYNNLYELITDKETGEKINHNIDNTKKGYISYKRRRIKAIKLGGFESNGMLMPLISIFNIPKLVKLTFDELKEGDEFDELNGITILRKYEPEPARNSNPGGSSLKKHTWDSKMVDNQFNFHVNTTQLGKCIHNISPKDIVSITYKLHGTSAISSKVLVKKQLKWYEKLLIKLGVNIEKTHYDNEGIYASRKVVKNEYLNKGAKDYYDDSTDWRKIAHDIINEHLSEGMTTYYEIVGYTPNGGMIQKGYDYGYTIPENISSYKEGVRFGIYIYRLTYTTIIGQVHEFTAQQVQEWCTKHDLKPVPQLYYGIADGLQIPYYLNKEVGIISDAYNDIEDWREQLLDTLRNKYWFKQCIMCKNEVPSEGIVLRKEGLDLNAWKHKSYDFLQFETKQLDKDENKK